MNNGFEIVHIPVLIKEILENLNIKESEVVIDATADGGGHTLAFLKIVGKEGIVVAMEQDEEMAEYLKERLEREGFGKIANVRVENYKNINNIAKEEKIYGKVDAVIFDLGMSSYHVDRSGRGFTFKENQPLDMRYSRRAELTAMDAVNKLSEKQLAQIIRTYGQERFSGKIAENIVKERKSEKITTTGRLVKVIERSVPSFYKHRKIHCATKTFQALRIFVNDEFENIREGLKNALSALKIGGRMGVISFHSLEDRIVKEFGRTKEKEGALSVINKKPIIPSKKERSANPRSRSSKLRIFEKIG